MSTTTLQALLGILDDSPTARWNYVDAVGSSTSNPAGLGNAVSLTYSFLQARPSYDSTAPSGFAPLTSEGQAGARLALAQIADIANITFTEVSGEAGQLTFGAGSLSQGTAGFAYYPSFTTQFNGSNIITGVIEDRVGGDIWLRADETASFLPGGDGFHTLIHEALHALGIKHPFEGSTTLPADLEHNGYTVMSYTAAPNSTLLTVSGNSIFTSTVPVRSLMPGDIIAIQHLYGANTGTRTGNDTYRYTQNEVFFETLWDGGGNDTIDASAQTLGSVINLTPGAYSSIALAVTEAETFLRMGISDSFGITLPQGAYTGSSNLAIADGVIIENAIGGSGNDRITGNEAANRLQGGLGDDQIDGGSGIDTAAFAGARAGFSINRSASTLTVSGAEGNDTLTGIERLAFADGGLAFDLDGNAGLAARAIGSLLGGAAVTANPGLNGVVLGILDGGASLEELMTLGLNALGAGTAEAVASLFWTNLVGSTPSASDLQPLVDLINGGMSFGAFGAAAANLDLTASLVNLTGLAETGLVFA